jgi:hypothetical protein
MNRYTKPRRPSGLMSRIIDYCTGEPLALGEPREAAHAPAEQQEERHGEIDVDEFGDYAGPLNSR